MGGRGGGSKGGGKSARGGGSITNAEAIAKFQAGQMTPNQLSKVMQANAKAQVEAENIARHGTANSVARFSNIRNSGRSDSRLPGGL